MKKVFLLFLAMIIISSCDELDKIFNPSSDYLLDKTIKPSSEEQIFESGNDFKIIFPNNSVANNLELKVKKESSVPPINIHNLKPGKNFYRIKFNGDVNFLKPIQIIINYDKSSIPKGKTAKESIFAYIYSLGSWNLAKYQLDESKEKIIIEISGIIGKYNKDLPILLENGDIILGDFSTTDTGQNDNLLKLLPRCQITVYSDQFSYGSVVFQNLKVQDNMTFTYNPFVFSGNNFSLAYNSRPDIDPASVNPETSFWFQYYKYSVTGNTLNETHSTLKNFEISEYRDYYSSQIGWHDFNSKIKLSNVNATYVSKNNDTLIYYMDKNDVNRCLNNLYFNFDDKWEGKVYNLNKSDINVIIMRFTK